MLKRFEVTNFKGFEDKLVFDLSSGKYSFNSNLSKNGIVNKAIIYGKNGSGKSNLGIGLFDLVSHLTDKNFFETRYIRGYVNYNKVKDPVVFKYVFQFGEDTVVYEYEKRNYNDLLVEDLYFNNKHVVHYNYLVDKKSNYVIDELKGNLDINLPDNKLSILKFIYKNTPHQDNLLHKMMDFVERMLWFRCLSNGNNYVGYTNGSIRLAEKFQERGELINFEKFLKENGLDYKLRVIDQNGEKVLCVEYKNGAFVRFEDVSSTGTDALYLLYYWKITAFTDVSFVFIDNFDAFSHFKSCENIIRRLNKYENFQTVLTSHNIALMNNKNTRPDCCYIIENNKIKSLANSTDKEIREVHNLEKMYVNGVFNDGNKS